MDPPLSVAEFVELLKSDRLEDARYSMRKLANAAGKAAGRRDVAALAVDAILEATVEKDVGVRRHASRGLANLTERGAVNKMYLARGTRYRSWVLAELDAIEAKTKLDIEKGGVRALSGLSTVQSEKARRHASRDLAFLAQDDPHVKQLFHHSGGARALVALGKSSDSSVCLHAVEALLNLAVSGRIEQDCKYLDILPALTALSESADVLVRRASLLALHRITAMMEAQNFALFDANTEVEAGEAVERSLYRLAKAGVVAALVKMARAEDLKIRQHAVRGLANFAQSDVCRPFISQANGEEALAECAKSADVEEKGHAMRAIAFMNKISVH